MELLAADLSDNPRGKLPTSVATMLRAAFDVELRELWNREAWPELCDHIETVTLDASNCFSLREGDADEMGDILSIIEGGDPRLTTAVRVIGKSNYTRLANRVNVVACTSALWVDWQTPAPDLLDIEDGDLAATRLPRRFKLALAARGAAEILQAEDPARAGVLRGMAEADLLRQVQRLDKPWWRR